MLRFANILLNEYEWMNESIGTIDVVLPWQMPENTSFVFFWLWPMATRLYSHSGSVTAEKLRRPIASIPTKLFWAIKTGSTHSRTLHTETKSAIYDCLVFFAIFTPRDACICNAYHGTVYCTWCSYKHPYKISLFESLVNFQKDSCNICHIPLKCYHFTLQNGKKW